MFGYGRNDSQNCVERQFGKPGFDLIYLFSMRRPLDRTGKALTQGVVGVNPPAFDDVTAAIWLLRLVVLFCRENDGWPTGILPLAFSDIPRS